MAVSPEITIDRSGGIEPIGVCPDHGRMIDEGCPDRHLVIAHDQTLYTQVVDMHQGGKRHAAFVGDSRVDVGLVHFEEQPGHLCERRWTHVSTRVRSPAVQASQMRFAL